MRDEMGVRGVLVYCADHHCSHSVALSADQWPDNVGAISAASLRAEDEMSVEGCRQRCRSQAPIHDFMSCIAAQSVVCGTVQ
jgi:hypothetical protein